jgi:hypothetical protein
VEVLTLLLAVIGVGAVVSLIGVALMRRVVKRGMGHGHNEMSAAIFTVGGTIYAVFLAFLVVSSWEAHDSADANVAEEASLLCTLYRGSAAMEPQSGAKLRLLIRRYTQAVISDEWPVQALNGGAAESARRAGLGMFRVFGAMPLQARQSDAVIDRAELDVIDRIQSDRNRRTLQAEQRLSPLMWWTALINGALVILMSFFLYPDRDWPHVVMSGLLSAMVLMLLLVVWIFAKPFGGPLPLGPEAFAHSLLVYDWVDRTP